MIKIISNLKSPHAVQIVGKSSKTDTKFKTLKSDTKHQNSIDRNKTKANWLFRDHNRVIKHVFMWN